MEYLEKMNCEDDELAALTEYYTFRRYIIHYDEIYLQRKLMMLQINHTHTINIIKFNIIKVLHI